MRLPAIPAERSAFIALVRGLFLRTELAAVRVQSIDLASGSRLAVVHMEGLIEPSDLARFLLQPLSQGFPPDAPESLATSGRLPAPVLRVADDAHRLKKGLIAGMAALHVDGHAGALLVGTGQPTTLPRSLEPGLASQMAGLRRQVNNTDLRVEVLPGGGAGSAVAYLQGVAPARAVQQVKAWIWQVSSGAGRMALWRAAVEVLRVPRFLESSSPATVAAAVRKGYVAALDGQLPHARIAPATLPLLFGAVQDPAVAPPVRTLLLLSRVTVAFAALTLSASFVAVTSYHHALLPGPFLIALASGRQNLPFPIGLEVLLIEMLDDGLHIAAARAGGRRFSLLAFLGTVLVGMTAIQAGVLAPAATVVGLLSAALRQVLPNPPVNRIVRIWRYLFIGAGVGLGLQGMAVLAFVMMAYLAQERVFGHPFRQPPGAAG